VNLALAAAVVAPALAVGSFLNVVASRLPLRLPLSRPRSACTTCSTAIAAWDNVPLLSYALLRGRCRSCRTRIPLRYPLVEAGTAILVVACVLRFGLTAYGLTGAFACSVLVVLAAIDAEHRIVPNRIVLPAAAVVLGAQLVREPSVEWPLAALGAAGFLLAAALVYPSGMGMGDVKLCLLLGALLGLEVTVAMMVALLAALLPSVVLLARRGSAARKVAIPFAPFLGLGAVVALFLGGEILDWYTGLTG
jgi:leader peptidase (prepilin peptidase)/N-methyltransferase